MPSNPGFPARSSHDRPNPACPVPVGTGQSRSKRCADGDGLGAASTTPEGAVAASTKCTSGGGNVTATWIEVGWEGQYSQVRAGIYWEFGG